LAIAISVTACGGQADPERIEWIDYAGGVDGIDLDGEEEDKLILSRYHGKRSDDWNACYSGAGTHDCLILPKVKDYFYAVEPGDAPSGSAQQTVWDAARNALWYYSQQDPNNQPGVSRVGFKWTEVAWNDPRRNVTVNLINTPDNDGSVGSGGCTILSSSYNAPAPIGWARFYRGCNITLNLGDLAALQSYCFGNYGLFIDHWAAGWWIGAHEGGHIMGFSHAAPADRVMYHAGTCEILNDGDMHSFTNAEMEALQIYDPTINGVFILETTPFFDPYPYD
jgi:hypothetical protein